MNDAAFGILGGLQPPAEQLSLWKVHGVLEIYLPPPEFIFAVKLFGYRDRDFNDVQADRSAGCKDARASTGDH